MKPSMNRAFTMLEIIVALALLLLLLLVAVLGFIGQLRTDRTIMNAAVASSSQAGGFIERLEGDLLGVIAGDPLLGAGLKGDKSSLAVMSRAISSAEAEAGAISSGLARTVYRFDESSGVISAVRTDALGNGTATEEPREVATGIARVRVRFYADQSTGIPAWVDSFDSLQRGGLPRAVEVAIWFGKPKSSTDESAVAAPTDDALSATSDAAAGAEKPIVAPDRVRVIAILGGGGRSGSDTGTTSPQPRAEVEP